MYQKFTYSFILIFFTQQLHAQTPINPPFSWPDLNIIQVGERAYAFGGTDVEPYNFDIQTFIMPYWRCFSSTDLVHWEFESMLDPKDLYMGESDKCFAGHGIERNGKWYWYFSNFNKNTGVAIADSPRGPWKDALGKPLLPEELTDAHEYDNCVFIDDDGQAYMSFGNHKNKKINYYIVALNDDMVSLKEEPRKLEVIGDYSKGVIPVDASFIHKHGDYYYLSWRSPYAISKNIYGPYTYIGEASAKGHLGYFDFNNQNFVNYTALKEDMRRRYRFCSLAYVHYKKDGTIAPMEDIIAENGVGQFDANWPAIQAEWFMGMPDGPEKYEFKENQFVIRNLKNGDYLNFTNVRNMPYSAQIEFTYACDNNNGGDIIVKAFNPNGPEIGRATFGTTGSWETYKTVIVPLNHTPEGEYSVSFVFEGSSEKELIRIDSFRVLPLNK
ncbi:hypothetical protein LH29_08000 [Draconibacterium sediminis]|uniref:CBM6 domain-containing protein n=2 Tax=Draconibacterium sediminis TaxID=1544798 RepID=A0A0D8JFJ5_9BACT|nr:hypothetical protein LH29_08000 [Draconibacterium sediminis]